MCMTIHMHLAAHCSKMENGYLTVVLSDVLIFWPDTSSILSRTVTTGYVQRHQVLYEGILQEKMCSMSDRWEYQNELNISTQGIVLYLATLR